MLWLFVWPSMVCLLDFFCSGVRFCLLLGPCFCFVSFLCLDLYVLGDDALVGWGSFVQAGHLCVLIHIRTEGEVGAPLDQFGPSSKKILCRAVFLLCVFCLVFVVPLCTSVYVCLVVACWGLVSWLSFVVFGCGCRFPIGVLGRVWCLVVSIPDFCTLTYFVPVEQVGHGISRTLG